MLFAVFLQKVMKPKNPLASNNILQAGRPGHKLRGKRAQRALFLEGLLFWGPYIRDPSLGVYRKVPSLLQLSKLPQAINRLHLEP